MMTRLPAIDSRTTSGRARKLLQQVENRLGRCPTALGAMAHSPAALQGYVGLAETLEAGTLGPRLCVQIALAVSAANTCQICLTEHSMAARTLGLDEGEIDSACDASSSDPRVEAALRFARSIAEYRGDLTEDEFGQVRRAGYSDEEIAELIANVVLTIYANYFNSIAQEP